MRILAPWHSLKRVKECQGARILIVSLTEIKLGLWLSKNGVFFHRNDDKKPFNFISNLLLYLLFIARSPVFNHFSVTLLGLPTIRAFRVQDKFFELFTDAQDTHTEAYYTFLSSTGWLSFNLDLISGLLVIFCSFVTVAFSDSKFSLNFLLKSYIFSILSLFSKNCLCWIGLSYLKLNS